MAKSKNEFSFDELNKQLSEVNPLGSTMDESTFSEITDYIHTGNYLLNACLTGSLFKGVPNNRSLALSGESGVGKTFLLLNIIREAQKKDYYVIFYDSEAAVDKELMEKFSIDVKKVRYEPVNTVEEFRTSITNLTKTLIEKKRKGINIPKIFVALDSAGNLATQKEIDDAISGSEKADMTRAKRMKSIFRILTTQLAECKIPFIFTNHVYFTQDFISKMKASGGSGPEYSASIILFLTKAKLKGTGSDKKEQTGIIVTAKPNKNRFAKPQKIKFHIDYNKGMNPFIGLQDYLTKDICGINRGKLDKKSGKIEYGDSAKSWIIEHLDNEIVPSNEIFTSKIFNKDVLKKIDRHIEPMFNYGVNEDVFMFEDGMLELDENEDN